MNLEDFNTVDKIALFTKEAIQVYIHDQDEKGNIIKKLAPLYSSGAEGWKLVVEMGKFKKSFTRVLGIKRMKALKKILLEIERNKYSKIDFGDED